MDLSSTRSPQRNWALLSSMSKIWGWWGLVASDDDKKADVDELEISDTLRGWKCGGKQYLTGSCFCCMGCYSQLAAKDMIMSKVRDA